MQSRKVTSGDEVFDFARSGSCYMLRTGTLVDSECRCDDQPIEFIVDTKPELFSHLKP